MPGPRYLNLRGRARSRCTVRWGRDPRPGSAGACRHRPPRDPGRGPRPCHPVRRWHPHPRTDHHRAAPGGQPLSGPDPSAPKNHQVKYDDLGGGCTHLADWNNGTVTADYDRTDTFRGASFTDADFTGANFRDCDLHQVKITDSWLTDVRVSGLVDRFVVNDVDVTAFVEGELDRRHPERIQLRQMRTADDYRAMWDTIERLWADT